jgi:hypothetical protein
LIGFETILKKLQKKWKTEIEKELNKKRVERPGESLPAPPQKRPTAHPGPYPKRYAALLLSPADRPAPPVSITLKLGLELRPSTAPLLAVRSRRGFETLAPFPKSPLL